VKKNDELEMNFEHLYFAMKAISLLVTAFFVFKFYRNYQKMNVESNLKKFILQIIRFKKTVNIFIFTNIALMILFTGILTVFVFQTLASQHIHLNHPMLIGFLTGIFISISLSVGLIWLYYRIAYGIITRKLSRNLEQLKKIETETE
jgi:hypothetical protein